MPPQNGDAAMNRDGVAGNDDGAAMDHEGAVMGNDDATPHSGAGSGLDSGSGSGSELNPGPGTAAGSGRGTVTGSGGRAETGAGVGVVTVTTCEDGPLLVRGAFELVTQDGESIPAGRATVALCRCGLSSVKPFCDGSHKAAGFKAASEPDLPA